MKRVGIEVPEDSGALNMFRTPGTLATLQTLLVGRRKVTLELGLLLVYARRRCSPCWTPYVNPILGGCVVIGGRRFDWTL